MSDLEDRNVIRIAPGQGVTGFFEDMVVLADAHSTHPLIVLFDAQKLRGGVLSCSSIARDADIQTLSEMRGALPWAGHAIVYGDWKKNGTLKSLKDSGTIHVTTSPLIEQIEEMADDENRYAIVRLSDDLSKIVTLLPRTKGRDETAKCLGVVHSTHALLTGKIVMRDFTISSDPKCMPSSDVPFYLYGASFTPKKQTFFQRLKSPSK